MNLGARQTHLEFYREHQITPVRYDLSSMDAHLERRFSLYAKLGLLPVSFKNVNVLEVAAGTGHNSLYLAQLLPSKLTLLEPNEVAVEYIKKAYSSFDRPHTKPTVIAQTVQDYSPQESFDIVLCENWLGTSQHDLALMKKISTMVNMHGMLVLTTMPPIGFVPNLLRRFMSSYLAPMDMPFNERTEILVSAFGSHLATLKAMTRNYEDWVQDNMINPAYFGLGLSIPKVLDNLEGHFEAISSSPVICEDWRWFKGMHGKDRQFNEHFLSEYWKKAHNFLDYREEPIVCYAEQNIELEKRAEQLLSAIAAHEDICISQGNSESYAKAVISALDSLILSVPKSYKHAMEALREVRELISSPSLINPNSVAKMTTFCSLFGRETVYISLIRVS